MFDSPEELLKKIQLGEDTSIEYKAVQFKGNRVDAPSRNDLADEIAAMANTHDGVLVLGVDDKSHDILGIPIERLDTVEAFVHEICTDSIRPRVSFRAFRMELPDGLGELHPILKIEIPRSLFVHRSPGGYYHRQGSSKREMEPEYLARLFQQRSQARLIRFEEQAVPGTTPNELDEELWRRYTERTEEDALVVLLKRSLLTRDEAGELRATVAGVLLATRHPENFLQAAFVEAVSYRGVEQDSNYQIDAQRIYGPLDTQIEQTMNFLRRNQRITAVKEPHRVETPQFSERAVFEAIVNAVAHRDYSIAGSKIRFFLFEDRLEIYSPGALPNTITVDSLSLRQSTRNELITSLLAETPVAGGMGDVGRGYYMEKRGDGVPIILRESQRISGRTPEYRLIDDSELLLTLYSA